MAGKRYPVEVRREVLRLGKEGKTYAEIRNYFPIPKSTLSVWFKKAGKKPDRTRQLEHLKRARAAALITIRERKAGRLAEASRLAKNEVESIAPLLARRSVLKALIAMLYWAEGSKGDRTGLIFVNTDPELLSLYVRMLRAAYLLDESKFRVRLHLHHYHKHRDAKTFWSRLLKIPESQFGKIYVKKRSARKKFRKNFQGICIVVYHDSGIRRELLAFGRLLAEK
ncbi:hypothetical protein KGQ55_02190 [Patescibacteria group bacterium]|nr:hypothetical protein [Patescibacteria group bacterium]